MIAARAQQLVVDLVELALADRDGRLQLVDRARPRPDRIGARRIELHHAHPVGDRAAGHDHHLVAGAVQLRQLVADPAEHVEPRVAALIGDDRSSRA